VGKWEIFGILDEGTNSKIRSLLIFWGFHGKNVDEAWSLLEWIAWASFEFEKASCFYGNSLHDPCAFYARSYYAPLWLTCVVLLTIMLNHVLIIHAMLNLTLHHIRTVVMLS